MTEVKLTTGALIKKVGHRPVKISAMASSQEGLTKPEMCAQMFFLRGQLFKLTSFHSQPASYGLPLHWRSFKMKDVLI